jgi:hypothetical protein
MNLKMFDFHHTKNNIAKQLGFDIFDWGDGELPVQTQFIRSPHSPRSRFSLAYFLMSLKILVHSDTNTNIEKQLGFDIFDWGDGELPLETQFVRSPDSPHPRFSLACSSMSLKRLIRRDTNTNIGKHFGFVIYDWGDGDLALLRPLNRLANSPRSRSRTAYWLINYQILDFARHRQPHRKILRLCNMQLGRWRTSTFR